MPTLDERVAALEVRMETQERVMDQVASDTKKIVAALNMGRGAWALTLRVGAALVVVCGAVSWIGDKLHWWK